jgi:outer membrane protein assembly factor BamB
MDATHREFTAMAMHPAQAHAFQSLAFIAAMAMQPEWEKSGYFGGSRRPLNTNGLLIAEQTFNRMSVNPPPTFQMVAIRLDDGSDVWSAAGNIYKRILKDEANFYYISFVSATRTYKVVSAAISTGSSNWERTFGSELVSAIFLDDTQLIALSWFDDEKGFHIYTMNAADGAVISKQSIPDPHVGMFWFAGNGDIVMTTGDANTRDIRLLPKPYTGPATVMVQKKTLTLFEGIYPNQCFYATDPDADGISSLGRIDLATRRVAWEKQDTQKFWGVFEEDDKIIALQQTTNASVYTRRAQDDGKVVWQTIVTAIQGSIFPDDGVYAQKYFITGGSYFQSGWASKTYGLNMDNGRVVFSLQRSGQLPALWALRNGDMIYVHTASGIMAINPSRYWRKQYGAFKLPAAISAGIIVAVANASDVSAVDLSTGRQNWKRSMPSAIVATPAVNKGRVYAAGQDAIYALELASGSGIWTQTATEGVAALTAIGDLIIYTGRDKKVRAIDRNKALQWTIDATVGVCESGFAYDADRVYFGDNSGMCYGQMLNGDANKSWRQPVGPAAVHAAPLVAGNHVLFADDRGQLNALNRADGAVIPVQNDPPGAACVGMSLSPAGDAVILAGADGVVRSRRVSDGSAIWTSGSLGSLRSAPAISGNSVFVGTASGTAVVLDLGSGKSLRAISLGGHGQAFATAHPDAVVMVDEAGFMQALLP